MSGTKHIIKKSTSSRRAASGGKSGNGPAKRFVLSASREEVRLQAGTRKEVAAKRAAKAMPCSSRDSAFGGEVAIIGLPGIYKQEVLNTIRHLAKDEESRDPQNRILKIEDRSDRLVIYTSHANLAVAIGKHVHRSRKGGALEIEWPKGDEVSRVRWVAGE